jgi:hypothetical protein
MAAKARHRLLEQVRELYAVEQARYDDALAGLNLPDRQAQRLADAATAVKAVR